MTLLETIQDEISNLSTRTRFEYEDLEQANANIFDKLQSGDFPVCLILPFDIKDVDRENGSVKSSAEINAIFLNRIPQADIDKPSLEVEQKVVSLMRTLAREFVNRLDDSDIIQGAGITSVVHRSVHQAVMDAHLYGSWAVFSISFTEDNSVCP